MSLLKVAPEGLKAQESEQNKRPNWPQVPYILEKDVMNEVLETGNQLMKPVLLRKQELRLQFGLGEIPSNSWCISNKPIM